jgi:hypothetical protein
VGGTGPSTATASSPARHVSVDALELGAVELALTGEATRLP